ncbi:MAG TPA: glycosyltransferase family 2 protein [Burkholderiales bacterium]|nr:glycosyltransferase family 2 protein [Burkholderiales bacterium]
MKVSAIVITKDNERTIRRCIESLRWADEIVVVDSGSTDATPDICRALGARVHVTVDWPGHGPQKNRALDLATGEWVFSLDSDEWVTPGLRAEIERTLAVPDAAGYAVPRRSSFCGRFMRHSGWWPDYVVRLFRRDAGRFTDDHTHERLKVDGAVRRLREPIMHEAIDNLEQMLGKMNAYSTAAAHMKMQQGKRGTLVTAVAHGVWAFFRTYVLRLGFLDGREGFMLAVANAEGSYYRYVKLMLLTERW